MPPPQDDGFSWARVSPDQIDPELKADLARQVRIMVAAGKSRRQIADSLQQNGLSPEQAAAFLGEVADAGPSEFCQRLCGRASLVLIAILTVFVVVLVLVQRPWDGNRWTWTRGGSEIPAIAGFVLFCFLYGAAMTVLWFLAVRFGGFLDWLVDRSRGKY